MSDRDPNIHSRQSSFLVNNSERLNLGILSHDLASQSKTSMPSQVSAPPSPYLEARVFGLENGHASLRQDVDVITELYHGLCSSVDKLKLGGWPVTVGPFQEQDLAQSHQSAMEFKQELEKLTSEVHKSGDSVADVEKANATVTPNANGSVPPHLRGTSGASSGSVTKSLPPHLRSKDTNSTQKSSAITSTNDRLVTDGPVDTITTAVIPASVPSPPSSLATAIEQDLHIEQLLLATWKPHFLTTLSPLPSTIKIPAANQMITFHPQFLQEHLAGTDWSPGLRFIPGDSTCILKNRTYYLLNPVTEPYLPENPGQHGAKLTPFFNKAPEDFYDNIPDDANTYEHVPMFVEHDGRYVYYGNYSQTRWSDKLGFDTMMVRVPQHIKEHWATELTSPVRQEWVTEELKKHFFQKPEYEGRIYLAVDADTTTVTSEEEVELDKKMTRDVRKYAEQLREWEREAKMKTAMIKKQFILDAFDAADADDPPALRLWWEYLECVDWRRDFYDLLVTLQSREDRFLK